MSKKDFNELALKMHEEKLGKVSIQSKVGVSTKDDLSTAYTPGVAAPCLKSFPINLCIVVTYHKTMTGVQNSNLPS